MLNTLRNTHLKILKIYPKLNSYVRLRVNNLNLDLETPYKLNDIEKMSPTVMGFSR